MTHRIIALIAIAALLPVTVSGTDPLAPYEQEFVITAYYSPEPGQCCYVKGGYVADKILNGEGHTAADGTPVYPGMLAAPPGYVFGTAIDLPGIGVLKVHDRGGAIQVLDGDVHRLDIWAGAGEEGLARALAFGVQRIKGTVYPVGSSQPQVQVDLAHLPAPLSQLSPFMVEGNNLLRLSVQEGDRSQSVAILQNHLADLGYFQEEATGFFGHATADALAGFLRDHRLAEQPSNRLTEHTAATLMAAIRRKDAAFPVPVPVDQDAAPSAIMAAQRLLRFLGYYRGRTTGTYDDNLASAILRFQQEAQLVGSAADAGAGRIGPQTAAALKRRWNRLLVADFADRLIDLNMIELALEKNGTRLAEFMGEGSAGDQVTVLQNLLAKQGYFAVEETNGYFGTQTKKAVIAFQEDHGIIAGSSDEGAGSVGPMTLLELRKIQRKELYLLVRSEGWGAL